MAKPFECNEHMYLIHDAANEASKIGRASDVGRRFGQIQAATVNTLELARTMENAGFLEPLFHEVFRPYRIKGEWYPTDSLPVSVLLAWASADGSPGALLHSLGEAIEQAEAVAGVSDDLWTPDGWDEWSLADLETLLWWEEWKRNEHERRVTVVRAVRETRVKNGSLTLSVLPAAAVSNG